jgi:hypothetical protein
MTETKAARIHKRQRFLILLALLTPLLLNAVGAWQVIGPDVLVQVLKGDYKVYGIPYNPWPRVLGPILVTTVLLGSLAWLTVFISTKTFVQERSVIVKRMLTAVLALLGAAGFGVGTFLIDVSWSSAFRFNATVGLPISRFVGRDVRFASCTTAIILFYALQLEGRGT